MVLETDADGVVHVKVVGEFPLSRLLMRSRALRVCWNVYGLERLGQDQPVKMPLLKGRDVSDKRK